MSADLTKARSQIAQVNTFLKQGKPLPAVNSLREAVHTMLRQALMKAEKTELIGMIQQAVFQLNNDKELRKLYPLVIPYQPGEEKSLLETLRELYQELQTNALDEARDQIGLKKKRIEEGFRLAGEAMERNDPEQARQALNGVVRDYPKDSDLRADVAEFFIQHGLYQDAFVHLDEAINLDPEKIFLYNRIGIVLRKLKQFDVGEKYFMRAVDFAKHDPNLYFNLGRLYIDWERWDKVERAARIAVRLSPEFQEAHKMLAFSLRKQGKSA